MRTAPDRVALGHADADATLQGGLALGGGARGVRRSGRQSAAATGFVAGFAGRVAARRPLVWIRQDFTEIESGALSMSGLAELGLDPRLAGDGARGGRGRRVADRRRRAGLRCAGRRRAGSLGRSAPVRSRRQPQADAGRAGLGRHRPAAAAGGGATALNGGDQMDRARGAFAAGGDPGARGARRCSTRSLSATVMALLAGGSWNGNVMSAFSVNRRRILSLWLPRLPIDRIKRQLARESATKRSQRSGYRFA